MSVYECKWHSVRAFYNQRRLAVCDRTCVVWYGIRAGMTVCDAHMHVKRLFQQGIDRFSSAAVHTHWRAQAPYKPEEEIVWTQIVYIENLLL